MKVLVIGGTLFLGRHLVDAALAAGHEVTLFNRGKTNPGLYPHIETIRGDRETDLALLDGRRWDSVIDTCGYLPGVVGASCEKLRDAAGHYTFISSISVYAHPIAPGSGEDAPVQELDPSLAGEFKAEHYGGLKLLCEREVEAAFPGRCLIVRAGLLAGPHDPTGRLAYWIRRIAEGGEVLAPGDPHGPVQVIDARDLAEWALQTAAAGGDGVFNVAGPAQPLTMRQTLEAIVRVTGSDARLVWAPEPFLLERGVSPWTELPLWVHAERSGMLSVGIGRALESGLRFRRLESTLRDTQAWIESERASGAKLASGVDPTTTLSRQREQELLDELRAATHRREP